MPSVEQEPRSPSPAPRRRRRWIRRAILASIFLSLIPACLWAFCNFSLHGETWTRERIDPAVQRGLDYLCESSAFAKSLAEGGESPPHFFFLEKVLDRHEHPCLRDQIRRAKERNRHDPQWRAFFGMPGWPRHELTPADETWIRQAVATSGDNYWAEWLVHALYPTQTRLRDEEYNRLFEDPSQLGNSYQLTHALIAYLWMQQADPREAQRRSVADHIESVNRRLAWAQACDLFTSDIYNERVAFWLYMDNPPPVRRRWIERIILSQNHDGGWTYDRSLGRALGQLVGHDPGTGRSHPHATFLALYTLSEYGRMANPPAQ